MDKSVRLATLVLVTTIRTAQSLGALVSGIVNEYRAHHSIAHYTLFPNNREIGAK